MVEDRSLVGDSGGVDKVRSGSGLESLLPGTVSLYPSLKSDADRRFSCVVSPFPGILMGGDLFASLTDLEGGKVNCGSPAIMYTVNRRLL